MLLLYLVLMVVLLFIYIMKLCERPKNFPPGPKWVPYFGNLLLLKELSKKYGGQYLALAKLAEQYKTKVLGLKLGINYVVIVFSYDVVRKVLTEEVFESRPENFFMKLRCMGQKRGLTCTDGEFWKIQRSFVVTHLRNLGFGKKPMDNFISEEIHEVSEILRRNGKEVKIGTVLAPAVINILWALMAGSRISRSDKRLDLLLKLLDKRTKAFDIAGGTLSQLPWLRFVAPEKTGFNLIQNLNKQLKDLFHETIAQHMKNWSEEKTNDDLIYSFITEMKKDEGKRTTFTEHQLIMVCLDLFIAGAQTTSTTLDFAFLMMILHPDIQMKVHQVLDKEFRSANDISYADRVRVPFVEAVLLEVERYLYVIPILGPRRALRNTVLEGYEIPKGATVLMSFHSVHHDKDYWKDPEVFRPDRFLDDDGKLLNKERLITFGLGKRRCLGDALAKSCIFVFFAEIMRKYEVCLSPGSKIPTGVPLPGITITPEDYKAKFIDRLI